MNRPRHFAIVPAAGRSRRMGRPKLLLPWGRTTVIESILAVWQVSPVDCTVVVVRPDDQALAEVCRSAGAEVVVPDATPAEMKDSVILALEHLERRFQPSGHDAWLLMPADVPQVSPAVISQLTQRTEDHQSAILVPTFNGQRGHPVLFPWPMSREVYRLGRDQGINVLLGCHPVEELPVSTVGILQDIDTPEDFEQLRMGASP